IQKEKENHQPAIGGSLCTLGILELGAAVEHHGQPEATSDLQFLEIENQSTYTLVCIVKAKGLRGDGTIQSIESPLEIVYEFGYWKLEIWDLSVA
ncbi:hypothetical protein LINPERHAP1_LOCUS335, partial [Linum perenne]